MGCRSWNSTENKLNITTRVRQFEYSAYCMMSRVISLSAHRPSYKTREMTKMIKRALAFNDRWRRRHSLHTILRHAGLLQPGDFSRGAPLSDSSDDSSSILAESSDDTLESSDDDVWV